LRWRTHTQNGPETVHCLYHHDRHSETIPLEILLTTSGRSQGQQLALFALLTLGMIESLANGLVSAVDALRVFFNADNCLFVRNQLRSKVADKIMGHGVQLPDLFDALPIEEAHL
jgi:hypothetical protein